MDTTCVRESLNEVYEQGKRDGTCPKLADIAERANKLALGKSIDPLELRKFCNDFGDVITEHDDTGPFWADLAMSQEALLIEAEQGLCNRCVTVAYDKLFAIEPKPVNLSFALDTDGDCNVYIYVLWWGEDHNIPETELRVYGVDEHHVQVSVYEGEDEGRDKTYHVASLIGTGIHYGNCTDPIRIETTGEQQ